MDSSFFDGWSARLVVTGVIGALLLYWFNRRRSQAGTAASSNRSNRALDTVDTVIGWPPEATRIMTLRHRRAFDVLRRSVPECMVLAQVPLSRFIKVPTRLSYMEWLRRVGHVCIDLVVCDAASNVIAVIEISETDRTENERTRKRRQRIERVLRSAGIPLHVWNESWLPDPLAVRRLLLPGETSDSFQPQAPVSVAPPVTPVEDQETKLNNDPPRSSWFDELHATRPNPLDTGAVVTHEDHFPQVPPHQHAAVSRR